MSHFKCSSECATEIKAFSCKTLEDTTGVSVAAVCVSLNSLKDAAPEVGRSLQRISV